MNGTIHRAQTSNGAHHADSLSVEMGVAHLKHYQPAKVVFEVTRNATDYLVQPVGETSEAKRDSEELRDVMYEGAHIAHSPKSFRNAVLEVADRLKTKYRLEDGGIPHEPDQTTLLSLTRIGPARCAT